MTKKADPALDEASTDAETVVESAAPVTVEGGEAESNLAADDPALTGIPRDERCDSIDPHTGTLTEEAVALRAEQAPVAE